jgi:hypothetical protein
MYLKSWTKHFDKGTPQTSAETKRDMELWQREKQLAGLRDPAELAKLPAEEQGAWRQFWADVAALHERAARQK